MEPMDRWDRSVPTVASGLPLDYEAPIYNTKSAAKSVRMRPLVIFSSLFLCRTVRIKI